VEKITLGPARRILLNPVDRECTAYHESGHALLGLLLPGSDPMHRVATYGAAWRSGHLSAPHRRSHQLRRGEISGMDLVLLCGMRLSRNEVYFDRMALFGDGSK
jgi:ATP-dependent Zn protease